MRKVQLCALLTTAFLSLMQGRALGDPPSPPAESAAANVRRFLSDQQQLRDLNQSLQEIINRQPGIPGAPLPPGASINESQCNTDICRLAVIASTALTKASSLAGAGTDLANTQNATTYHLSACLIMTKLQAGFAAASTSSLNAGRAGQKNTFTIINLAIPVVGAFFNCSTTNANASGSGK